MVPSPDGFSPAISDPEQDPSSVERTWSARLGSLLKDVAEAVVLAVVIFAGLQFAIQNTVVEGSSMEPNFIDGERLLVNKLGYRFSVPERGDVVVFHAPGYQDKDFIKRIVGLPGDSVLVEEGRVSINGEPIPEPWQPIFGPPSFGPYRVPEGSYFVLGDNRPNSNDSRSWKQALPLESIVGEVWVSVWPPDTWGLVASDGPGPAAEANEADVRVRRLGTALTSGR